MRMTFSQEEPLQGQQVISILNALIVKSYAQCHPAHPAVMNRTVSPKMMFGILNFIGSFLYSGVHLIIEQIKKSI